MSYGKSAYGSIYHPEWEVSTDTFMYISQQMKGMLLLWALLISLCSISSITSCICYHSSSWCQAELLWQSDGHFLTSLNIKNLICAKMLVLVLLPEWTCQWPWWANFYDHTCVIQWPKAECLKFVKWRDLEPGGLDRSLGMALCVACFLVQDRMVISGLAYAETCNLGWDADWIGLPRGFYFCQQKETGYTVLNTLKTCLICCSQLLTSGAEDHSFAWYCSFLVKVHPSSLWPRVGLRIRHEAGLQSIT